MPDEKTAADDGDELFDQTNGVLGDDPYGDEHPEGADQRRDEDEDEDLLERGAASNIASGGIV